MKFAIRDFVRFANSADGHVVEFAFIVYNSSAEQSFYFGEIKGRIVRFRSTIDVVNL